MAHSIGLSDAIAQYERHLRARGLADNTVRNTVQVLNRALTLWGDVQLTTLTHAHVDDLFAHYGWKESTRNLYLSRLNVFLQWCRGHRWMARDWSPTDGWRPVRVPRVDRTRVPVDEFAALLDAATHPRDRAVCALGLFVMLRGSEIQSLRLRDLSLDSLELVIYRHKTKQADVMPVSEELRVEMVRWLNWYRADQGSLRPDWFLVPAKDPNHTFYDPATGRIGVDTSVPASLRPATRLGKPYAAVQRALEGLGYDGYREGEHTLRRSGARALADALNEDGGSDGALMRVASMLGHSDVRVTQKYIGWEMERRKRNEAVAGRVMFPAMHRPAALALARREA